jgi:hypothetical protein
MIGRAAGLLAAFSLAACAHAGATAAPPVRRDAPSPSPSPPAAPARVFQGAPQDAFWVTHEADRDRIVARGARLELAPSGEVRASAWEVELAEHGEPVVGSLAVPPHLGGGFVHWTHARVFRSHDFVGPLEPVAPGVRGELAVRGARSGLASVLVFTDAGPRELAPGRAELGPLHEPGVLDAAALSPSRAVRLDVFGRASATLDGGRSWLDLSASTGSAARALVVGDGELSIDTWQGRFSVGPTGKVELTDPPGRMGHDASKFFQIAWKSPRVALHDELPWSFHEHTPLQAAVAAGAAIGDGTAFAVSQTTLARVDLASGKVVSLSTDWFPSGLECQPVRAPDGVLFACVWERYQGYGGYVLRSVAGEPPALERVFTDDGSFVADDDGAIGYLGSCRAEARYVDPEDPSRMEGPEGEPVVSPVMCVRSAPGVWVERRVSAGEGMKLVAWVPRRDGSAAALALSTDPLPPPRGAGAPRVVEQGGVRLVRLYREISGWSWVQSQAQMSERGSGLSGSVDRRFRAYADGSIDGWLWPPQGSYLSLFAGVTIDPRGFPAVHELGPAAAKTVAAGSFALSLSREGDLHESTDHGRTWRPAGKAPLPAGTYHATCSPLGCSLGPLVRVGWGDGPLEPRVAAERGAALPAAASVPRLSCAPSGAPAPASDGARSRSGAPPRGARQTLHTSYGETLEIVADAVAPAPAAPPPAAPAPPAASPPAAARKPPRASPAVLRTHTLILRPPLEPHAALRRLNATDASFNARRRTAITPLLGPSGEVDLLISGDATELLVAGESITSFPAFEARRYTSGEASGMGGLLLAGGRARLLGEQRRRVTLEDHGPGPPPPPLFLGLEREQARRRPLTLGRRDDGGLAVLVFDGPAPEMAGAAALDRSAPAAPAAARLAPWSSVLTGDDPRCRKGADRDAYRALLVIDPSAWLELDPAALPGISLSHQGLLLVRWGRERVCLEGIDASVVDQRRRGDQARSWSLVARWGGEKDHGATLRTADLRQELACRVEAPPR